VTVYRGNYYCVSVFVSRLQRQRRSIGLTNGRRTTGCRRIRFTELFKPATVICGWRLDGLARFDGVRFTIFNKSNSPGIVNNRFVSLFEAASGDLWAGTEESGIVRYGLAGNDVKVIIEARAGGFGLELTAA
jgi:hypothetical protein